MATPLDSAAIRSVLQGMTDWSLEEGDGQSRIVRRFEFGSFKEAMSFLVRVGFEAEAMNHHPTLTNVYNRVTVVLNTHDAGGRVTQKDVDLAQRIGAIDWTR